MFDAWFGKAFVWWLQLLINTHIITAKVCVLKQINRLVFPHKSMWGLEHYLSKKNKINASCKSISPYLDLTLMSLDDPVVNYEKIRIIVVDYKTKDKLSFSFFY